MKLNFIIEKYDEDHPQYRCKNLTGELDRKNCNTDTKCLKVARLQCDYDPKCFGFSWNEKQLNDSIRFCKSSHVITTNEDDNNLWHTRMKSSKCK